MADKDFHTEMQRVSAYLLNGKYLAGVEKTEKRAIRRKAANYTLKNGSLYKAKVVTKGNKEGLGDIDECKHHGESGGFYEINKLMNHLTMKRLHILLELTKTV